MSKEVKMRKKMKNLGKIILFLVLIHSLALGEVNSETDYSLKLQSTKKEVYVGEPFEVTLLFKQRRDAEPVDSEFTSPKFSGFWIKSESKPQKMQEGDYDITKIVYKVAAQRVGNLKVSAAKIRIATRVHTKNSEGLSVSKVQNTTYFSNELNIEANALVNGVDLVGDFSISARVEKSKVEVKEALHLTLEVLGEGNIEDISILTPSLLGVNVFEDEAVINANKLTQKVTFVAENDFTIPPYVLSYLDIKSQKIKTIATQEITVKVKNAKAIQELILKEAGEETLDKTLSTQNFFSDFWIATAYIVGLLSGVLLMIYKPWNLLAKEKRASVKKPKTLLWKLLPYNSDKKVDDIINALERNIYLNNGEDIDKKVLKEIIEKYKIS